jgi:hypothetical protein
MALTSMGTFILDCVGVLELNSSAGIISIGNDAVAQNIQIGTGAASRVITLGNTTGVSAVNLVSGTAGTGIATTNGPFAVTTGTGAINLGVDAFSHIVTIGNVTGTTAVNLNAGTGGIALASTGAGDITIDSDDTLLLDADGVLELNSSAGIIGIGSDADAFGINIGTGAAQRDIVLGNVTGTTSLTINTGTGGYALNTTGAGDVVITGSNAVLVDAVGVLELNSSAGIIGIGSDADNFAVNIGTAGVRTVTIGNGTGATSVVIENGTGALNIGTNATVHTTTIGSATGASATVIQSGSGKIDFAGVVQELTADFVDVSGDKITFRASPIAQSILDTCVIPTGVAGTTDLLAFENGMIMEQFVIGTQTILAPRMGAAALGLTVSCDLANGDGKEYNFGAARTSSKHSFTIGTSPAFFMEVRFTCLDVSSLEPAYFGFRKTQANDAAYGNYTDFVGYGLNDGVAPGDCAISTRLNSGAQVDTDTNDVFADGSTHTLRVMVSAAGVVTFLFDGAPPTVTQAFTFDNGDVVHPFWTHLMNATVAAGDEIYWISMEVGNQ